MQIATRLAQVEFGYAKRRLPTKTLCSGGTSEGNNGYQHVGWCGPALVSGRDPSVCRAVLAAAGLRGRPLSCHDAILIPELNQCRVCEQGGFFRLNLFAGLAALADDHTDLHFGRVRSATVRRDYKLVGLTSNCGIDAEFGRILPFADRRTSPR